HAMSLRRRTHWTTKGLFGVVTLLGAIGLFVTPAAAGIGGSDTPTWPTTATGGQLFDAHVVITNSSSGTTATQAIQMTALFRTPPCGDGTGPGICLAPNLDPGVFKVLPGTVVGDPSTAPCAGIAFGVGAADPSTGEVKLTPASTILLGATNTGM